MNPETTFATISLPPSTFRPNDLRGIDLSLDNVCNVFGADAVLLPVPANVAGNMSVACAAVTLEQTLEVAHQVRLCVRSIGNADSATNRSPKP